MDMPKFEDIFKQIILNFKLCGISANGSVLGFNFYISWSLIVLMLIEESSYFFAKISSDNILELTALAPCIGIGFLSLAKITAIAMKRNKMFELMESLDKLYDDILRDIVKKSLVRQEVNLVKSLTKYYFILNVVLISVYNVSSLLLMLYDYITEGAVNYLLPFAILVPISTDIWINWLVLYVQSALCGFICVLYFTTVDAMYCNMSSQVCINFTIIREELKNMTPANYQNIIDIVMRHQLIIKLSNTLEDIFTAPNLFNMLIASVEICALGFNIMRGDIASMPNFILFLSSEILQIFMMSVFGENLVRESGGVGNAAWHSKWYEMEPKYKTMILLIMIRSQKPQKLTAYKFSTICYGSFTKIISTSWSYFTILNAAYKPADDIDTE